MSPLTGSIMAGFLGSRTRIAELNPAGGERWGSSMRASVTCWRTGAARSTQER